MAKKKESLKDLKDIIIDKENQIKVFHIIIQWFSEINEEFNNCFDSGNYHSIESIDDKCHKISKMFKGMGYSKGYSAEKIREKFDKWSEFYAKNYFRLNRKLSPETQEIFDFMKIIHVLDIDQMWTPNDSTYIRLKKIKDKSEDIEDYLNDLEKRKFVLQPKRKTKKTSESETFEEKFLSESVRQLVREEEEIRFFHSMVKMIDPKAVYWKNTFKNWNKFATIVKSFGNLSKIKSIDCKHIFYKWSEFYGQNYYKLNDDLEPKLQDIFDLLKIVHILDRDHMWRSDNRTYSLLETISNETEIKDYLNTYKNKSLSANEDEEVIKVMAKNDCLNASYEEVTTFEDMNLRKRLILGINAYGFERPQYIQKRAIIPIISGRNVIAQAQSGTGKTAAFIIGILQRLDTSLNECQALILTPTRELAQQIQKVVSALAYYMRVKCDVCIGGSDVKDDVLKLKMGAQIMVGTSGRISDMIQREALNPKQIKIFVSDEADHMLTGRKHREQFFDVFNALEPKTQVILSSATFSKEVLESTKLFIRDPIRILVNNEELTLEGIKQFYVRTESEFFKFSAFSDLYHTFHKSQAFIYCNTRDKVDWLTQQLQKNGFTATHIHGDMKQRDREAILRGFQSGFCRVLLTSDLLGRGIDVQQMQLVVNYDLPQDHNTYIHRVGRSGRFGRKGIAITFVADSEIPDMIRYEKYYSTQIKELPTNWEQLF